MSADVAAVIVAYRSEAHLPACLEALHGKVRQAVVVDNTASDPPSASLRDRFGWVSWIDNDSNRGFAAAANQGVAATDAPYVLLLNPDCELLTDLDGLVRECETSDVAGAGGLLRDPDGRPQIGFFARSLPTASALAFEALGLNRAWPRNPVNRRYRLLDMQPDEACDVPQPAGALLLLRREALAAVGGLDERFHPAWFEDVDLCRRLGEAGFRLRYSPSTEARHAGGHAVASLPLQQRLVAWYCGLLRYADKHFSRGQRRCVRCAVLAGLFLRAMRSYARAGTRPDATAYWHAARLASSGFPSAS